MFLVRAIQVFIISTILLVCYYWAPRLDGYIAPVLTDAQLTQVKTEIYNTITTTVVEGNISKVRDCDLLSVAFYLGQFPDNYSNVRSEDMRALLQVQGPQQNIGIGPYRIFAPVDILRFASFVIITHNCYDGMLWNTQTVIRLDKLINDYEAEHGETSVIPQQEP